MKKLPRWVEVGGFALTITAGSVNAIGMLGFRHQAVSHLSGSSTLIGEGIAHGDLASVWRLSLIVLSFLLGATLSGLIIQDATLRLGKRYGVALLIEAFLLYLAMLSLDSGSDAGHLFASAACGLQNALASTYSGAVVRTTHVTGIFTDIGILLGARLRGVKTDTDGRRLKLYLILIVGFILGGTVGTVAYQRLAFQALAIPASLALLLSLTYWGYWYLSNRPGSTGIEDG